MTMQASSITFRLARAGCDCRHMRGTGQSLGKASLEYLPQEGLRHYICCRCAGGCLKVRSRFKANTVTAANSQIADIGKIPQAGGQ